MCKVLLRYRLFFKFLTSIVSLWRLLYIFVLLGEGDLLKCKTHGMQKCLVST